MKTVCFILGSVAELHSGFSLSMHDFATFSYQQHGVKSASLSIIKRL